MSHVQCLINLNGTLVRFPLGQELGGLRPLQGERNEKASQP